MKKILLSGLAIMIGLAVTAQKPQIRKDIYVTDCQAIPKVVNESAQPLQSASFKFRPSGVKNSDNPNIVTVIELGTSANVLGYSGGSRTMLWADDDLNAVVNFHRAGPGSTPPSLSGYYAMDLGTNMGMTEADWTPQIIVSNALLASSPYYYDASRYPSAGIYNPAGNTNLANAYCAFFGPNFANLAISGFGGYTYGRANLVDFTDTIKHLRWYDPTPYTYVPDGFTIGKNGIAHMVDRDINAESGGEVYQDSVIYGRGVWNEATKDFDYTFRTFAFPCEGDERASDCKIAASPDGNIVWMSVLTNYPGATPLIDSTYFPVLRNSTDGGLTWSEPIVIQLDGPGGIDGIKNAYSDYFIENFFVGPPFPSRDEIPYTTAFDHSLSVDKWGIPHIGVAVGYAPGGYSISYGVDSLINVFDIIYCPYQSNVVAAKMGSLKTFRGTWGTNSSDNRVYISRDKTGEHMFFTWNDTFIEGEVNNQNPDVFARGFDLVNNKITSENGMDAPTNVTFLCDITQEAYWQCTSPIIFTDNNKYTLPICTQWFADPEADSKFKYIPDFSFVDADFTLPSNVSLCPVGIEESVTVSEPVTVYPNPANDRVNVTVGLQLASEVTIEMMNVVGSTVIAQNKGLLDAGNHHFSFNVRNLNPGLYFVTVHAGGQLFTRKLIVN